MVLAAALLLWGANGLGDWAFQTVLNFRTLERIPLSSIQNTTGGEVQFSGQATPITNALLSPETDTPAVYYRYMIEREEIDSDGDRRWETIHDEQKSIDFILHDGTGSATVLARSARSHDLSWSVKQKFIETRGKLRYTEWRIDVNDNIRLYGWADVGSLDTEVSFNRAGDYLPLISAFSDASERSDRGWQAALLLAAAMALLIGAMYALALALHIHRVLTLLFMVSVSGGALLFHYGWDSLTHDVRGGYQRTQSQFQRSQDLVQGALPDYSIDLAVPFDLQAARFSGIEPKLKSKIDGWRMAAWQVNQRYRRQISRFPESWFARSRGLAKVNEVALPDQQLQSAQAQDARFVPTSLGSSPILTSVALLITFLCAWFAFRFVRVKRMQENLPSCGTAGVVFGLTELVGELRFVDPDKPLQGPLSGIPCSWYRYLIEERRGSGKNARWVTIEDNTEQQIFQCADEDGAIAVDCRDAEVISEHRTVERRGSQRHQEWRLQAGDQLYILGKAAIDSHDAGSLALQREKSSPFIVSNLTEHEVMLQKAAKGMALLSLSAAVMFFAQLLIAGSGGGFSSLDFLLAGLNAPLFFALVMLIILYNDMVFLQGRVHRAGANIEVALKKRFDLIPAIQNTVQTLAAHEQALQTALAELRQQAVVDRQRDGDLTKALSQSEQLNQALRVQLEAHPVLSANATFLQLSDTLSALETEIAMMRKGYNDAVELYNTRIQSVPDLFLARLINRKSLPLL